MSEQADQLLRKKLADRLATHSFRNLVMNDALTDFCSNDYLGLARSEFPGTIDTDPLRLNGATGSRLLRGNSAAAEHLEHSLAFWYNSPAALVFNSGYIANLGFFSTVPQRGDTIIYDESIHASIRDGVKLSHARYFSFRHNDHNDLVDKLGKCSGLVYIAVESVYSMDGDEAPLKEIAAICESTGALLVVDEAHALGLMGAKGGGICREAGIEDYCFARILTFGKAAGAHGAAILGSSVLIDFLINFCRPFIYTTAMAPESYGHIGNACKLLQDAYPQRHQLNTLILHLNEWKEKHPEIHVIPSRSAIHSLVIPGNERARALALHLQNDGFDVRAILSPTVPEGSERLRICLHSFNSLTELSRLQDGILHFFSEE